MSDAVLAQEPPPSGSPAIGDRIKAIRTRLGLNQVEFAALLGVSNVTVNRWERGRVSPAPAMWARLTAIERGGAEAMRPRPQGGGSGSGNLPVFLTSFLGRGAEVETLRSLLERQRLLTLTGPAGCGKTRLAVEVACAAGGAVAGGVWFVDLTPLGTGAQVAEAMARVLGVRDAGRQPLAERIAAECAGRPRLIVLDNCEHLLGACAEFVAGLLAASATVSVLATSRAPLGLPREALWPVPSLSPASAVALFRERAREHDADFGRDEGVTVAEICDRLDRLPLAIEMAAARTQLLSVGQIANRLSDRFSLLRSAGAPSAQAAPLRQRSIGATTSSIQPSRSCFAVSASSSAPSTWMLWKRSGGRGGETVRGRGTNYSPPLPLSVSPPPFLIC